VPGYQADRLAEGYANALDNYYGVGAGEDLGHGDYDRYFQGNNYGYRY